MPKTILIFFGPQGSGKGTQADLLAKKRGWMKISAGDLLRQEVQRRSVLGGKAHKRMRQGELVPDCLIYQIIEKKLRSKAAGFIFDGYPRNMRQHRDLLELLHRKFKHEINIQALEIKLSDQEAKKRLGGRRSCVCGAVYHLICNPPKQKGICDVCGKKLFVRSDDKPRAITRRLNIYHREIEPMLDYWQKQGKIIKINGEQSIKAIAAAIGKKLNSRIK